MLDRHLVPSKFQALFPYLLSLVTFKNTGHLKFASLSIFRFYSPKSSFLSRFWSLFGKNIDFGMDEGHRHFPFEEFDLKSG